MWFTKQTKETENVTKTFEQRVLTLEIEVRKLKNENIGLTMDVEAMRNKVLRKIQTKKDKEEEDSNSWAGIPTG